MVPKGEIHIAVDENPRAPGNEELANSNNDAAQPLLGGKNKKNFQINLPSIHEFYEIIFVKTQTNKIHMQTTNEKKKRKRKRRRETNRKARKEKISQKFCCQVSCFVFSK